jgi:hypothetical protein
MVLCTLAVVGACTDSISTKQDLAACKLEAIKIYPNWGADWKTDEEPHRPGQIEGGVGGLSDMGDVTRICMEAKGYEYDPDGNHCGLADTNRFEHWRNQTSERCYRKASR